MNFKEWILKEDYGSWDWQADLHRQRDPLGVMRHGDNLISKGVRGLATGIGDAVRGELEKTGASTSASSVGHMGTLPDDWKSRKGDTLEFSLNATDCFKKDGTLDISKITSKARLEAFRQIQNQENLPPEKIRSIYMIDRSPVQIVGGPTTYPNSNVKWLSVRLQLKRTPTGLVSRIGNWTQQEPENNFQ